jgi:hypothetical protein
MQEVDRPVLGRRRTSAAATKENPSLAVEEFTSLPQGETVALGAEATPPEATVVEGT